MKITIIGTTSYQKQMQEHKNKLENDGHEVKVPAFDNHPNLDDLGICEYNRKLIKWAEEIHLFWDQRSIGTVFDFGMVFMAEKPLVIIYMETKTFKGVMEKYEHKFSY